MSHEDAPTSNDPTKDPNSSEALERARLRRNQRNSRARKQAYIRDLESRWNECVKLGAHATVEMQKEARRVQDENKLLRTLLYSQGFDNTAIESALQSMKLPMASQDPKSQTLPTDRIPSQQEFSCKHFSSPLPTSTASAGTLDAVAEPVLDVDLAQSLDLHNWLSDLCEIKKAFGAEANSRINDQYLSGSLDYTGPPLGSSLPSVNNDTNNYLLCEQRAAPVQPYTRPIDSMHHNYEATALTDNFYG